MENHKGSARGFAFALSCAVAVLFSLAVGSAPGDELADEVRKKCAGFQTIARFVQGTVTSRDLYLSKKDGEQKSTFLNQYKQNRNCVLMIEKQEHGDSITEKAYVINPKYGFVLVRNQAKQEWTLGALFLDNPNKVRYGQTTDLREHVTNALSLAYPPELLIGTGGITKTQEKTENGVEIIVLDFLDAPTKESPLESKGQMRFVRTNALALLRIDGVTRERNDITTSRLELEYEGKIKDFARLVKRTDESVTVLADGGSRTGTTIAEFDLKYDENVPDSEFTLSAFGLPNPKGAELPQPARYTWLWWGAIGVGILGVAYFIRLRRRASRTEKPSPE